MSTTKYYSNIWHSFPFPLDFYSWDSEGRSIKDMVLNNKYATDMRVSEMHLNITRFSAFDTTGKEHFIADFPGQDAVSIKGMHAGAFLRSKGVLTLEPGSYTTLRFYLAANGSGVAYSDRVEESVDGFEYLDFEIENGLTIQGNEAPEAILRFDFVPFSESIALNIFKQLFRTPRRYAGKLADSLAL